MGQFDVCIVSIRKITFKNNIPKVRLENSPIKLHIMNDHMNNYIHLTLTVQIFWITK